MTHRPAEPLQFDAAVRQDVDGDDSIEFAEFTPETESSPASPEAAPSAAAPAWFRPKPDSPADSAAANAAVAVSPEHASPASGTSRSSESSPPRKRKKRRAEKGGDSEKLIDVAEEEQEPIDWRRDWKKIALLWLTSAASCGYGVSFLFHSALLIGLSAIIYTNLDENESISMFMTDADAMPVEFEEVMDFSLEAAGSPDTQLPQLQKIPVDTTTTMNPAEMLSNSSNAAAGEGEGGQDEGFGFQFRMPTGGKAVTQGSFTAWTVPEDPEPRRDYMIVIRIRLPERTRMYRISDLSGKVVGTDAYVQHLPLDPNRRDMAALYERSGQLVKVRASDRLRVIKNHVQIMIPVKGAASLVRDTIEVKSRMLKEEQKLEIVF